VLAGDGEHHTILLSGFIPAAEASVFLVKHHDGEPNQ
jgi:hypothetical protein